MSDIDIEVVSSYLLKKLIFRVGWIIPNLACSGILWNLNLLNIFFKNSSHRFFSTSFSILFVSKVQLQTKKFSQLIKKSQVIRQSSTYKPNCV